MTRHAPREAAPGARPAALPFVEAGGARLEVLDIPAARDDRPELLLLHEGLGCVSMWREFPAALAAATGCRTIAYSREGFGRSSPRRTPWTPHFMNEEAYRVLPELRERLGIARPVLVGHSTGASMALVHAGAARWEVAGVVAMAPLLTIEEGNLASIRQARRVYEGGDWREKLARHHDDVDGVFYGWNDTWLAPEYRHWHILAEVAGIRCPVLGVSGLDDPYSSPAQADLLLEHARACPRKHVVRIADCGHAPHRERPEIVIPAIASFVDQAAAEPA